MKLGVDIIAIAAPIICAGALTGPRNKSSAFFACLWTCCIVFVCCIMSGLSMYEDSSIIIPANKKYAMFVPLYSAATILCCYGSRNMRHMLRLAMALMTVNLCVLCFSDLRLVIVCSFAMYALVAYYIIANYKRSVSRIAIIYFSLTTLASLLIQLLYLLGTGSITVYIVATFVSVISVPVFPLCHYFSKLCTMVGVACSALIINSVILHHFILYNGIAQRCDLSSMYGYRIAAIYAIIVTVVYCAISLFTTSNKIRSSVYISAINNGAMMAYVLYTYNHRFDFLYCILVMAVNVLVSWLASVNFLEINVRRYCANIVGFACIVFQICFAKFYSYNCTNVVYSVLYIFLSSAVIMSVIRMIGSYGGSVRCVTV